MKDKKIRTVQSSAKKVSDRSVSDLISTCRTPKIFRQVAAEIGLATTPEDLLGEIYNLFSAPTREVYRATKFDSKTGEPLSGAFVVDEDSKSTMVRYWPKREMFSPDINKPIPMAFYLKELFDSLEYSNQAIAVHDESDGVPVHIMNITREQEVSGGQYGRDAHSTDILVFRKVARSISISR